MHEDCGGRWLGHMPPSVEVLVDETDLDMESNAEGTNSDANHVVTSTASDADQVPNLSRMTG